LNTTPLRSAFCNLFGAAGDLRVTAAPGRVNLIGEHTDYNDGWVLPMAIDRYVWAAFAARSDRKIRAHAVAFEETREFSLDELTARRGSEWSSYVAGMAWAIARSGHDLTGIDILIDGNVPLGSGLSSSAALEMATARALCVASEIPWDPKAMALLGQEAENEFVGVSCGIMDQFASAAAEERCALLLDCRSLEMEAVPFPAGADIVVMDTGSRRKLTSSAYNERRVSCETAVTILRKADPTIEALRDVDRSWLDSVRSHMDEVTYRRASHVIDEIQRPSAMSSALRMGHLELAGELMNESHASLCDLYEVSSFELDLMTELARQHPACFGARLTGAGFGGCAVALVATSGAEPFIREVQSAYRARVGLESELFASEPVGGARLLAPDAVPGSHPLVPYQE
jgi:galactokinase